MAECRYRFESQSRNYSVFSLIPVGDEVNGDANINPVSQHLFDQDILSVDTTGNISVCHSPVRDGSLLYGVLVLKGNRTYGRIKNRLCYQCIPHDRGLPAFLVPYEQKTVGHSKVQSNLFIEFRFANWTEKHPIGTLTRTFGEVSSYNAFSTYSLHARGLMSSISPMTSHLRSMVSSETDLVRTLLHPYLHLEHPIEDRRSWNIISIDPPGCIDIDDAFSITGDDNSVLSIYIANVPLMIDALGLWGHLSDRISTIYLPDSKVPMLPVILSDNLCSLLAGKERVAIAFDFSLSAGDMPTLSCSVVPCLINVTMNYAYEDPALQALDTYLHSVEFINRVTDNRGDERVEITDTHRTIEWMMIEVNKWVAQWCLRNRRGILRTLSITTDNRGTPAVDVVVGSGAGVGEDVTHELTRFLQGWNTSGGEYHSVEEFCFDRTTDVVAPTHAHIGSHYTHASSPIRRIVDLINLTLIQQPVSLFQHSDDVSTFLSRWMTSSKVTWIQQKMREIRKVENDCGLMWMVTHSPERLEGHHPGLIIGADNHEKRGIYGWNYSVYLYSMRKVFHYWSADELRCWTQHQFEFYTFEDNDRITEKVRIRHITHKETDL